MPSKTIATNGPPIPIMDALEALFGTIARGKPEAGPWYMPKDAIVEVRWLAKKGSTASRSI